MNYSAYYTQPEPIKVYKVVEDNDGNQVLEFVDLVTNYTSYSFSRNLTSIGTFEITIEAALEKSAVFKQDYVIQIGNDHNKQGQVKRIIREMKSSGTNFVNTLRVIGPQMKHIMLGTLICPPASTQFPSQQMFTYYDDSSGDINLDSAEIEQAYSQQSVASIMEDLVKKTRTSFVDGLDVYPLIADQEIPNLRVDTLSDRGFTDNTSLIDYTARFVDLATCLQELSETDTIGWEVYYDFDNDEWVFQVVQGINRTKNQSDNDWAVFSFDRGNISSAKYDEDYTSYMNDVLVGASGEDELRRLYYIGNPSSSVGIYNKVSFKNASDITDDDETYSEVELAETRADEELTKNTYNQTLTIEGFVGNPTLVLDEDYTLGDFVSIDMPDWDLSGSDALSLQVTVIKEVMEAGSIGSLTFTFGDAMNTLSSILRKELTKFRPLVNT